MSWPLFLDCNLPRRTAPVTWLRVRLQSPAAWVRVWLCCRFPAGGRHEPVFSSVKWEGGYITADVTLDVASLKS